MSHCIFTDPLNYTIRIIQFFVCLFQWISINGLRPSVTFWKCVLRVTFAPFIKFQSVYQLILLFYLGVFIKNHFYFLVTSVEILWLSIAINFAQIFVKKEDQRMSFWYFCFAISFSSLLTWKFSYRGNWLNAETYKIIEGSDRKTILNWTMGLKRNQYILFYEQLAVTKLPL